MFRCCEREEERTHVLYAWRTRGWGVLTSVVFILLVARLRMEGGMRREPMMTEVTYM